MTVTTGGRSVRDESEYRRSQLTERLRHYLDERPETSKLLADVRGRVFPDHWSFLLGQVALHSFVVVLLSGVFLMFFYEPSMTQVTYDGPYAPLKGIEMSSALESTLGISFEVRGGLLMRQVHHWASLIMVAAIMLHILRLFFTGAFRKPRRSSWLVTFFIFVLAMAAAFTGAVLPDDKLSGTSLAIAHGVVNSIPVVGSWLSLLLFRGDFPGNVIGLFYPLHVVILPALLLVLIGIAGVLALVQQPAQFSGPGRAHENVVGRPLPVAAAKSGGLFFIVFGVVLLIAATFTVNPIWNYGPADPANASADAGPLWFLGFVDGALRLVPPGWEFVWLGTTWTPAVLIPVFVVSLFMMVVAVYPFLEAWITGDRRTHHILERPRDNPTRTGIGVAGIVFYGVLWGAAGAGTIATQFRLSAEGVLHAFQALVILGPIIGFLLAKRICLGLQRKDRDVVRRGFETGQVVRLPDGGYAEVHQQVNEYERWRLASFDEHPPLTLRPDARGRITRRQRLRVRLSKLFSGGGHTPVRHGDPGD